MAFRFQQYLRMRHMFSTNYISEWFVEDEYIIYIYISHKYIYACNFRIIQSRVDNFIVASNIEFLYRWEKYVYLRGRTPLMINSNYYILDSKSRYISTWYEAHKCNQCIYVVLVFMYVYMRAMQSNSIDPLYSPCTYIFMHPRYQSIISPLYYILLLHCPERVFYWCRYSILSYCNKGQIIGLSYYCELVFKMNFFRPTTNQVERASSILHHFLCFKDMLEDERLEPMLLHKRFIHWSLMDC